MEKKKIVLFSLIGLLVVVIIAMAVLVFNKKDENVQKESSVYEPLFLSLEEKEKEGIPSDIKAQAFYDDEGNLVYKIIRSEDDVVWDLEELNN